MKAAQAGNWVVWRALACLLGVVCSWLSGASQPRDERAVRAAYVFNLTKYVEWPASTRELWIGFAGERSEGEFLARMLEGKTSESRPIHLVLSPSEEELKKCNILYIAEPQASKARAALNKANGEMLLTVGEADSFARDGGMVGLVKAGDHIEIVVNLEAAQKAGIKISSQLLSLAQIVSPGAKN